MPVDTPSKEYTDRQPDWSLCRAVIAGRRAVVAGKEVYLDRLDGHTDDQYAAYQRRAGWYDATSRTLDGLGGMLFRKEPIIVAPDSASSLVADVTNGGMSLRALCEVSSDEVLSVGRYGVLVEFTEINAAGMTAAEYERIGARPKAATYPTESIIDVRYGKVGGAMELTHVRLKEAVSTPKADDEFSFEESTQYRVLDLTAEGYRQRVFRKNTQGNYEITRELFPKMKGQPLPFIPFQVLSPGNTPSKIAKPPILGLAEANIDLYRMQADYRHGLHFTALPTPVFPGLRTDDLKDEEGKVQPIKIGSGEAVLIPDPQAKPSMLEFTGAGLGAYKEAIESKKQEMATLGARMISQDKRAAEAAETAQIHRQGENSVLAGVGKSVSEGLTEVLGWMMMWAGVSGDYGVEINTDFMPVAMDPQLISQLLLAVQSGEMSQRTFFYNLKKGEMYPDGHTFEDEQDEIGATL